MASVIHFAPRATSPLKSRSIMARDIREHAMKLIAHGEVAERSGFSTSVWKKERFTAMLIEAYPENIQLFSSNYVLDIWHNQKKVFSIVWDRAEDFEIVSFRCRNQWETAFLAAG